MSDWTYIAMYYIFIGIYEMFLLFTQEKNVYFHFPEFTLFATL